MNPQEAFLDLLIAAMLDAAVERKLTQLQTCIDPRGSGKRENMRTVRIIIVPELMDHDWHIDKPLGSKT